MSEKLTEREFEVIRLLEQGFNISYIAKRLYVGRTTVSTYLQRLYRKFGIEPNNKNIDCKTRSIYLFRQYKDKKIMQHLADVKQNLAKDIDSFADWYVTDNENPS